MNRNSLFLRLFIGNLLIVVVVVTVTAVVSYRSLEVEHFRAFSTHQDYLARVVGQYLEHDWPLPPEDIDRLCKAFLKGMPADTGLPVRLTVIDADGRVLGDSEGDPAHMANHRTPERPEVLAALEGGAGLDVRRSETLAVEYRYMAKPIRHGGEIAGAVRVAMPVVTILRGRALMRDAILWASLAGIATFALLGLLINWIWYAPLKQITQAAGQIASGDLTGRAQVFGSAELAQLGQALNAMRDSLARQIRTISDQREGLRQVLANLREGVIALDGQGCIVLMNRAAVALLAPDETEVAGRPLLEVVRVADLVEAYHRASAGGEPVSRQIETEIKGRRLTLDLHALRLAPASGGGIGGLLVVRDVTVLVRTAAVKAEFVANASHELRTPLATLRAVVDSLAGTDVADREAFDKFISILDRHVTRLEDLTLDLLDLHAVETEEGGPADDRIPLGSLAEWARQHFEEAAASKEVALEFQVPSPEDGLVSSRRLLELILQNLIDNAVKFTPAGGRVACLIERRDGTVEFRVSDTGCGIRTEDQPRVFERFYQADPARSGDTRARGTGLGLAIVKHAAERLRARVSLKSELGKGTTVTLWVPDRAQA